MQCSIFFQVDSDDDCSKSPPIQSDEAVQSDEALETVVVQKPPPSPNPSQELLSASASLCSMGQGCSSSLTSASIEAESYR